jgi:APA family basic amino acid/polyamine antiporter
VVAPLGVLSSIFLMIGLPLDTWLRFVVWLVIGLLMYGFYGMRHSKLTHPDAQPSPA